MILAVFLEFFRSS